MSNVILLGSTKFAVSFTTCISIIICKNRAILDENESGLKKLIYNVMAYTKTNMIFDPIVSKKR